MRMSSTLLKLAACTITSITSVVLLFMTSEIELHQNNAFTRRYPHHPVTKLYDIDLGYNSYYIAGFQNGLLYLGNTTAPLHLIEIDLANQRKKSIRLKIDNSDFNFYSVKVKIAYPYFFIMDGTIPVIFRGTIGSWKAEIWMQDQAYFTHAIPINGESLYIKTVSSTSQESVLGKITKENAFNVEVYPSILEKQIDGVFDVDGEIIASPDFSTLGYLYYYRNQFLVLNSSVELISRETTIDTVSIPKIELSNRNSRGEVQLTAPPIQVNKSSAIYKSLMMINSDRLGRFEEKRMLSQASIIDVYNWKSRRYELSFYIYHIDDNKIREFKVYDNLLVAMIGNHLSLYQLKDSIFSQFF